MIGVFIYLSFPKKREFHSGFSYGEMIESHIYTITLMYNYHTELCDPNENDLIVFRAIPDDPSVTVEILGFKVYDKTFSAWK